MKRIILILPAIAVTIMILLCAVYYLVRQLNYYVSEVDISGTEKIIDSPYGSLVVNVPLMPKLTDVTECSEKLPLQIAVKEGNKDIF